MPKTLSSLQVGAKLKFGRFRNKPIKVLIREKNCPVYPQGAITVQTENIIKTLCADGKEAGNTDDSRNYYGNNRYIYSNIRKWMNSDAAAGEWYSAAHSVDAPPSFANVYLYSGVGINLYDTIPGFLSEFSTEEKSAILMTTLIVGKALVDGGGTETFQDKIFNFSRTELGIANQDFTEGVALSGFSGGNVNRFGAPDADCVAESSHPGISTTTYWYYWLRTPYASKPSFVHLDRTDSNTSRNNAYSADMGFRPGWNLPSSLLISDQPDAEGYYTAIYNQSPVTPPAINIPNNVFGTVAANISWGASSDPDGYVASYHLERKYDNNAWAEIYNGENLNFADVVSADYDAVQWRVRAKDDKGAFSPYSTSEIRYISHTPPPETSLEDGDLGVYSNTPPEVTFTVSSTDSQGIAIQARIDDVLVFAQPGTLTGNNIVTIQIQDWVKILNGFHNLVVTIIDDFGNSVSRTLTFQKSVLQIKFRLAEPMETDEAANVVVFSALGAFPSGSELIVETCNNGFDENPAWEDMTPQAIQKSKFYFLNKTKTAEKWGIDFRVTLKRGTSDMPVFLTSAGGNFA